MTKTMGSHHSSRMITDVWLTPKPIIDALGPFNLDPCAAPIPRPWRTADAHICLPEDGLAADWEVFRDQNGTVCPCQCHKPTCLESEPEKIDASRVQSGNDAVVDARNGNRRTLTSSRPSGRPVMFTTPGVEIAPESVRGTECAPEDQTQSRKNASGMSTSDTLEALRDSPGSDVAVTSTTLFDEPRTSSTIFVRTNGNESSMRSPGRAHIADSHLGDLKPTTSSRSATQDAREPSSATSSPPVHPAIGVSVGKDSMSGVPKSSSTCCPFCTPMKPRIWLNSPYSSEARKWLAKLADHGTGTALTFARTETRWFVDTIWSKATAVLFLHGRLHFCHPDGTPAAANAGAPSVLAAYGSYDAARLSSCGLAGTFIRLSEAAA